jgi:hypothetical protein
MKTDASVQFEQTGGKFISWYETARLRWPLSHDLERALTLVLPNQATTSRRREVSSTTYFALDLTPDRLVNQRLVVS